MAVAGGLGWVEPMLARSVDRLPQAGVACAFEPKLDGFRALLVVGEDRAAQVWSRWGRSLTAAFPDVAAAAARWIPPGTVLDGELVRWADGRLDFAALQRRLGVGKRVWRLARAEPVHFAAFDLLAAGSVSVRGQPLSRRRSMLEALFAPIPASCRLALNLQTTDVTQARSWMECLAPVGVEGLIGKALDEPYLPGRRGWWKYKRYVTTPAIVGGVTGSLRRPECLVVGRYAARDGHLRVAGRTSPLTNAQAATVADFLTRAGAAHPWPSVLPPSWVGGLRGQDPVCYVRVRPSLVVEVRADVATERGTRWRHILRLHRLRLDLKPAEVPRDLDLEASLGADLSRCAVWRRSVRGCRWRKAPWSAAGSPASLRASWCQRSRASPRGRSATTSLRHVYAGRRHGG